jgi:hypothetical protein
MRVARRHPLGQSNGRPRDTAYIGALERSVVCLDRAG